MKTKLLTLLPFLILLGIVLYSVFQLILGSYNPTPKHLVTFSLILVNIAIYFKKFSYGLAFTGILLILASFSALSLSLEAESTSYFINIGSVKLSTPSINFTALLLLILFCIVNFKRIKGAVQMVARWLG